jgi:hypothetical protein
MKGVRQMHGFTYDAVETIAAVKGYIARGATVIWLPHGSKNPGTQKDWQDKNVVQSDEVERIFCSPRNVGILLGAKSANLVDVDLDCDEAIRWAPKFLPPALLISGRPSKPRSHRFYQIATPVAHIELKDPLRTSKQMIVELRTGYNRSGKVIAQQTVVPPSLNPEGEQVDWDDEDIIKAVRSRRMCRPLRARCT